MRLFDDYKRQQLREAERARFHRWFVDSPMGWAYVDRAGRPRKVSPDELAQWRAAAYFRIEEMLALVPSRAAWSFGALIVILMFGPILLGALGFTGIASKVGVALATVMVEAGIIGIDIHDYWRDWQRMRDDIERAVAGRAPLPLDPGAARIPRNWFDLGQYIVVVPMILVYLYSHFDTRVLALFRVDIVVGLALLAWALHFAAKRHDRLAQERLRRR